MRTPLLLLVVGSGCVAALIVNASLTYLVHTAGHPAWVWAAVLAVGCWLWFRVVASAVDWVLDREGEQ